MKILGWQIPGTENKSEELQTESSVYGGRGPWYPVSTQYFDGEKTPGELGYLVDLRPAHRALRMRAYEAQLKSDIVKIITGKFFK